MIQLILVEDIIIYYFSFGCFLTFCLFIHGKTVNTSQTFWNKSFKRVALFSVRDLNLEVHGTNRFEVFGVCSVHAVACALGLVQGLVQSWFLYLALLSLVELNVLLFLWVQELGCTELVTYKNLAQHSLI